jgi:hypothetical protein
MLTIIILIIFLRENKIELFEAIILVCLWPLYLLINFVFFKVVEYDVTKMDINCDILNDIDIENKNLLNE